MLDRKFIITLCFLGYFWHSALMACTTTTCQKVSTQGRVYNQNREKREREMIRRLVSSPLAHLELVRDLRDEGGDLLHEPVHAALAARLQQRGDGQRGDAAVGVGDEVLQVQVARRHGRGMLHGHLRGEDGRISRLPVADFPVAGLTRALVHLVEGAHGGVSQGSLGGAAEELQHCGRTSIAGG